MIRYLPRYVKISFQEFPGHINLIIPIVYCGKKCPECHSSFLQEKDPPDAEDLTLEIFENYLKKYDKFIDSVIFFGGEHSPESLVNLVNLAKKKGLISVLYTGWGLEELDSKLVETFDYVKYGAYNQNLGGLDSPMTNQVFLDLKTRKNLNYLFQKNKINHKI